jgi:hypothetical protein
MHIKRYFILALLIIDCSFIFAHGNEQKTPEQPQILVRQKSSLYFPDNYQFLDGTPVIQWKQLMKILSTVPENKTLLKEEKGWHTLTWVGALITMTAFVGYNGYIWREPNSYNRETMLKTFFFTQIGGLAIMIPAVNIRNNKRFIAVENYNLSIMGIPIPNR